MNLKKKKKKDQSVILQQMMKPHSSGTSVTSLVITEIHLKSISPFPNAINRVLSADPIRC